MLRPDQVQGTSFSKQIVSAERQCVEAGVQEIHRETMKHFSLLHQHNVFGVFLENSATKRKHAENGNPIHYPGRLLGPGRPTDMVRRWKREGVPDHRIRTLFKDAGYSLPRISQILRASIALPKGAARAGSLEVRQHSPDVHSYASCKRLRWSAPALHTIPTARKTVTDDKCS